MITQQPFTAKLPEIQTYTFKYSVMGSITSQLPKDNTYTAVIPDITHRTIYKLEALGDNTLLNPLSGVGQTYSQISQ